MTEQEYRAADGVNKSTLFEMRRSPAHYKYLLEHPAEDTAALKFGRALHSAVLTPRAYKKDYAAAPAVDRRSNPGKSQYAAWKAGLPEGVEEISADDAKTISEIVKSLRQDKEVMNLLKGTKKEVPLFWNDRKTGIRCKCRIDALGKDYIVDLKTTTDVMNFERDADKYGYALQTGHYLKGVQANTGKWLDWYFIVVEKKPPYGVKIFKADPGFIDYGVFIRDELLEKVQECRKTDQWPSYQAGVITEPKWINWEE